MSKTIIIAEKPSVAQDIVRALTPQAGKFEKHAEHFENDQFVVTSAVGHLVEIKAPEEFDVKRGKWSFAHLPVVPPHFDLAPIDKAKTRLNAVVKLVKRKDVSAIINACDAGREGELIFRLIVQYAAGAKPLNKPIQRLWLQSMTPQAIRDGFAQLRSDESMQGLADAARSRSEADWLVGINGTRAMTAFNSRDGGFFLTTVGRVQTPTLSIVVEREEKIRKHVARDYWEVRASFAATVAHDITVFDGTGQLVNTFGAPGEGEGEFNAPTHLAFSNGHLYVSDTLNSRIQVFDADGRRIREFGERGLYVGNLMRPKGVALGDAGITYVVESYYGHLLAYNKQSELLLGITGSGLKGGEFRLPSGVWTDKQGRLFIADMFNGRVVVFQFL